MLKVVATAAVIWLGALWAFAAVMHARAVMKREALTLFWRVNLLPLAVIGFALDVAFNLTFGTLMYRELPRELLFTTRTKRHFAGTGSRKRMADFWARQLNLLDPGHV
jgi:hypothetical protein